MHNLFTLYVWFAIAGGAMGGLKAFYRTDFHRISIGESVINFSISVATSVSVTTYIFNPQLVNPFAYLGGGIPIGYLSIYFLEIARKLLPGVMQIYIGNPTVEHPQ